MSKKSFQKVLRHSLGAFTRPLFENSEGDLPSEISYPFDLIYFKPEEFQRCTPRCDIMDMNHHFMYELDRLRSFLRRPIVLNSAYRSVEYELKHGRSGTSSHCKGLAVDIKCDDSQYRFHLLLCILGTPAFEFCRIGIGKNFVHLDLDPDKPSAVWIYDDNKDFFDLI